MLANPPNEMPPPPKILAPWRVKLRVAATSLAVLAVGALAAPSRPTAGPSRTEERANPLIEEKVAAAAPAPLPFAGIQDAAAGPRAHVVALLPPGLDHGAGLLTDVAPAGGRRAGAGVVVTDGYVLTHAAALDGRLAVRVMNAARNVSDAVVAGYDPATGLVILRGTPGVATPAVLASAAPQVGALAVGVAVDEAGPLALPIFVSAVHDDHYLVTGHQAAPGLPIFTLGGALIGVTSGGSSNEVVRATGLVDRLITRAAAGDVPRTFGLTLQRLATPLTRVYGERGLLVSDVVPGGPGARAGIAPGDVLLAVGGEEVTTVQAADAGLVAAAAAPEATLLVRRANREREVAVESASAYLVGHLAARGRLADEGVPVALLPEPVFAGAGLSLTTRLLAVNGQPAINRAAVERALAAGGRVAVLRVRDDRGAYFVGVEVGR